MDQFWTCRIGGHIGHALPEGADSPMRRAVTAAFTALAGVEAEVVESGWGGQAPTVQQEPAMPETLSDAMIAVFARGLDGELEEEFEQAWSEADESERQEIRDRIGRAWAKLREQVQREAGNAA